MPERPEFFPEYIADVALDGSGAVVLAGVTNAPDFPTVNPVQPRLAGGQDAFLSRLNGSGSGLLSSTYLGGTADDRAISVTVDSSGRPTVVGSTSSEDFPTTRPLDADLSGPRDAFVSTFSAGGSGLLSSSYLGGSGSEYARGVDADAGGAVYVLGFTESFDFPTRQPFQSRQAGGGDLFVTKLALDGPATAGSAWYVEGTNAGTGPPGATVSAYAVGAFTNVAYRLVLTTDPGCANVAAVLNPTTRFANSRGFIPRTIGTIPTGTPAGTYRVCFQDVNGATATGAVSFTVQ